MSKIIKGFSGCETTLHPSSGQLAKVYGFALIYPETIDFIETEWSYSPDNEDDEYEWGIVEVIKIYVKISSMISKSHPFPVVNKDDVLRKYMKFLEKIGLLEIISMDGDDEYKFIVYRKEPVVNG